MRRIAICAITLLSACTASSSTVEPSASTTPTVEPSLSASAAPAAGIERMCAAFDIVNEQIIPLRDGAVDDVVGWAMMGRRVTDAGDEIEDLAIGVESIQMSSALRTLGQRFQEEGARVQEGDFAPLEDTTDSAHVYYLELLEQYGSEC